jgi:hypothetical protein
LHNDWQYQGAIITIAPIEYQGFVYLIHDLNNNMFYIGKKNFWRTKKLPPLKGKKNKRHSRVESDWQDYYGSSERMNLMVNAFGKDSFSRTILHLCANKTMMSYWECKLQFQCDVLFNDEYYNEYIGCRINSNGLKG